MKYGYARVSTVDQNLDRQLAQLKAEGCDEIIQEKQSGKNIDDRQQFQLLLNKLKEGDTLVVTEMSRIGRSLTDLCNIVTGLDAKNVIISFLKEKINTGTDEGRLMMAIFGGFAEYERTLIRNRQRQGIEIAKQKGKYKGRRPVKRDPANLKIVFEGYINNTLKLEEAAGMIMNLDNGKVGVTIPTFYKLLDKWCQENGYAKANRYVKTEQLDKEVDDFINNYKL